MIYWTLSFIAAASFGAFFRYRFLIQYNIFWGTMIINLVGSLLIGFLAVYLERHYPQGKTIILVAFLGSLTTFSSYSFDLVKLFEQGMVSKALLYAILSNSLCFGGCYLGWKFAQNLVNSH